MRNTTIQAEQRQADAAKRHLPQHKRTTHVLTFALTKLLALSSILAYSCEDIKTADPPSVPSVTDDTDITCDEHTMEVMDGIDNNCNGCVDEPSFAWSYYTQSGTEYLKLHLLSDLDSLFRYGFYSPEMWQGESCRSWVGACHEYDLEAFFFAGLRVVDDESEVVLGESTMFRGEDDMVLVMRVGNVGCFTFNDLAGVYEGTGCCDVEGRYQH